MAKLVLDIIEEYPFLLFGISSTASDYRICWSLNKALTLSMKREKSVELFKKGSGVSEHCLYTYASELEQATYRFVENKVGGSLLLSEIPKADYFLMVDDSPAVDSNELLRKLRAIKIIRMAFPVNIESLKMKQNLLLTT